MNINDLYLLLESTNSHKDVLIQLPNNEPPVDFQTVEFEGDIILFPVPYNPKLTWAHDTNIIETSAEAPTDE